MAVAAVLALVLSACGGQRSGTPAKLDPEADLSKQRLTVSYGDG